MRRLFDWLYRLIMSWMSKQPPIQTNAEETAEVFKQWEEEKKIAENEKLGKGDNQ